jgi:hypothetical protein
VKSVTVSALVGFLIIGCASQTQQGDLLLLDFLADGQTTRTEVLLRLGQPAASFESEHIFTYRIGGDSTNGYFVRDAPGTWYETNYSLVLVFHLTGNLESHSLVAVR